MASEAKRAKQDLNEILIEQLKCYICKSGLKAGKHRWYRCTQLHLICQDCKEGKEAFAANLFCDLPCKKKILLEHCKMTEALLNAENMLFNCENLLRGCQEKLDAENMIFHQSECIYRLVSCPNLTCQLKVPFHELLKHAEAKKCLPHSVNTSDKGDATFVFYGCNVFTNAVSVSLPPVQLKVNGIGTFIATARIKDGTFYHWIQFVGSSHEAKKFSYTLVYKNDEKTPHVFNVYQNQMA